LENRGAMTKSIFPASKHVFYQKSPLRLGSPNASHEAVADQDLSLLYNLILGKYSKFTRKNNFLALGACFPPDLLEPQVCRVKITFTNLPTNRFVCTTKISMKSVVKWILLRVRVRSRNTQPLLKGPCPQSDLKINEN